MTESDWDSIAEPFEGSTYFDAATALVVAARNSPLRNFRPFTSMSRLFLIRDGLDYSIEVVEPGYVEWSREGRYAVYRGSPYGDTSEVVSVTNDPEVAVEALTALMT